MSPQSLVTADRVTARIRHHQILSPVSLTIGAGERWTIVGPNGSGKSILASILAGARAPSSGTIRWPALDDDPARFVAHVSFEKAERLLEQTRHDDLSSIMHGRVDEGATVATLIDAAVAARAAGGAGAAGADALVERFGLRPLLQRGVRFLSTGELRKTLLVAAVARNPRLLVVDDPYDGLDASARRELAAILDGETLPVPALVLVVGRRREVPERTTHVVELDAGAPVYVGELAGRPDAARRLRVHRATAGDGTLTPHWSEGRGVVASKVGNPDGAPTLRRAGGDGSGIGEGRGAGQDSLVRSTGARERDAIVLMRGVSVAYHGKAVLRDVTWNVLPGDRWLVTGPNGAGKSTLLSLITGDNPKAYGQEIHLFGRRRGSGETVEEIRRRVGIVSGELQLRYPTRATVEEAVLSGFHDSIGLFEPASGYERGVAREWIARMGLAGRESARLRTLSFGMRRAVLVARALVKQPPLLIADEPTQGLDDEHGALVMHLLDEYAASADGALVYVTHDPAEMPRCITHHLRLVPGPEGSAAVARSRS